MPGPREDLDYRPHAAQTANRRHSCPHAGAAGAVLPRGGPRGGVGRDARGRPVAAAGRAGGDGDDVCAARLALAVAAGAHRSRAVQRGAEDDDHRIRGQRRAAGSRRGGAAAVSAGPTRIDERHGRLRDDHPGAVPGSGHRASVVCRLRVHGGPGVVAEGGHWAEVKFWGVVSAGMAVAGLAVLFALPAIPSGSGARRCASSASCPRGWHVKWRSSSRRLPRAWPSCAVPGGWPPRSCSRFRYGCPSRQGSG
jgi:hypothetical protein